MEPNAGLAGQRDGARLLRPATTFAAHFARWARARPSSSAARAAAVQRWENEGGSVKPADDAASAKIPL